MNPSIPFQPLGNDLFPTYPWRVFITERTPNANYLRELQVISLEQSDYLIRAGIEYRGFILPAPNLRFRTEEDETFFLLRYPQ